MVERDYYDAAYGWDAARQTLLFLRRLVAFRERQNFQATTVRVHVGSGGASDPAAQYDNGQKRRCKEVWEMWTLKEDMATMSMLIERPPSFTKQDAIAFAHSRPQSLGSLLAYTKPTAQAGAPCALAQLRPKQASCPQSLCCYDQLNSTVMPL